MPDPVLVAVAWPYANAEIHVGNLTGSYLPADIFARYQRLKGRQVLMVSGSDAHGTPITVRADAEGVSPVEVYQRFHAGFLDLFQQLGLTYDLFTSTHTDNHFKVSQAIFLALMQNGYLYTDREKQWFSPAQGRFLPDRYVEGTCYICGYTNARSDQCDHCGNLLDPSLLIDPRSKIDGSTPELRETEHYYLDLGKLQPDIVAFLQQRESYWRPNVLRQSLGQIQADGLHGRPITRDLDWGIPVPIEGWKGKCLYVWFEAVIGYLSAAIEWAQPFGRSRSLAGLVDQSAGQGLLLHRQGQHPLPCRDLAGAVDRLRHGLRRPDRQPGGRALYPALRRARQRVHEPGGPEDLRQPQLGRVGARFPHRATIPTRCAIT